MSTSRTRELWRDRASGESFVVELEDDRVLAAHGPVDPTSLADLGQAWSAPTDGRAAAFTSLAADLERRRSDFERRPLPAS